MILKFHRLSVPIVQFALNNIYLAELLEVLFINYKQAFRKSKKKIRIIRLKKQKFVKILIT